MNDALSIPALFANSSIRFNRPTGTDTSTFFFFSIFMLLPRISRQISQQISPRPPLRCLLRSALDETFYFFPTEAPSAVHLDSFNFTVSNVAHQRATANT